MKNHPLCGWIIIFVNTIKDRPTCGAACKSYAVGKPFRRALRRRQQNSLIGLVHATRYTGGHDLLV